MRCGRASFARHRAVGGAALVAAQKEGRAARVRQCTGP